MRELQHVKHNLLHNSSSKVCLSARFRSCEDSGALFAKHVKKSAVIELSPDFRGQLPRPRLHGGPSLGFLYLFPSTTGLAVFLWGWNAPDFSKIRIPSQTSARSHVDEEKPSSVERTSGGLWWAGSIDTLRSFQVT